MERVFPPVSPGCSASQIAFLRKKNPLGGGLSVAQIAPFSVPVEYLRSYVKQVKADGGWLDLYRLEKMGLVPFFGGTP